MGAPRTVHVRVLFTPVHASWANPVEVQFSILTRQVITGAHHTSPDHLGSSPWTWCTAAAV